jgi:hypothetical protein
MLQFINKAVIVLEEELEAAGKANQDKTKS